MMNCYTEMLIENDKYINMNINIDLYNFYVQMSVSLKATNPKRLVQKKKKNDSVYLHVLISTEKRENET